MRHLSRLFITILLLGMSAFVFLETVEATGVSVWVGTWRSYDIPGDGSTNTLEIAHGSSYNTYDIIWRETYFSVCEGSPGIGYGTAYEDHTGLHMTMEFQCKGMKPQTFDLTFTYNSRGDTLSGADIIWERISPRPW